MKRHPTTIITFAAFATALACGVSVAQAKHGDGNPEECFPACVEAAPAAQDAQADALVVDRSQEQAAAAKSCGNGSELMRSAEKLNAQIKPVKDLVGYVRSPQGLAVKLVNDHLFKIPGWVGFALDPVGTIKHKAIDEVRGRAKEVFNSGQEPCGAQGDETEKLSIDAA
ncbi:MAG: hypothetical protein JNJ55_04375 [Betaproteobacteria bacterium]|nr:hypothetical protein [Betaproteobacteria bacterium]